MSNPPYIPAAEVDGLEPEVRLHEDRRALDGGADGLDTVRAMLGRYVVVMHWPSLALSTC